jgi:hypothetical protein
MGIAFEIATLSISGFCICIRLMASFKVQSSCGVNELSYTYEGSSENVERRSEPSDKVAVK